MQRLTSRRRQPETWNRRLDTLVSSRARGQGKPLRDGVPLERDSDEAHPPPPQPRTTWPPFHGNRARAGQPASVTRAASKAVGRRRRIHDVGARPRPPNKTNKETRAALVAISPPEKPEPRTGPLGTGTRTGSSGKSI